MSVIVEDEELFYKRGANYWAEIPATIDGMLGGFGGISQTDIRDSRLVLKQLFNSKNPPGRERALDCGAGIGRITKYLLTDLFNKVDMVEQNEEFLVKSRAYLGQKVNKIGNFYCVSLQDFQPDEERYDVIWIQWVMGHLTDQDFVKFLQNCQKGLKNNGVIIVKENITSSDEFELDRKDSSVTRPFKLCHELFSKSNLICYRSVKQTNFPKELYPVYLFVLKPKLIDFKD